MSNILFGHSGNRRQNRIIFMILVVCLIIFGTVYSSWVLLISFVILPTLLVWLFDKSEHSYLRMTITGLNILGIVYAAYYSYLSYGIAPEIGALFLDEWNFILPFGLPCLGWGIVLALPHLMKATMGMWLQYKERSLKQQQRELIQTWGQKVKPTSDSTTSDSSTSDSTTSVEQPPPSMP